MKRCRHLVLICLTMIPAASMAYIETVTYGIRTNDLQEDLISPSPTPNNFIKNHKVMAVTKQPKESYLQTFVSSSLDFSWNDGEALTMLLMGIVRAELSQCTLGIVWESELAGSMIVDNLSLLPNIKQIVGDGEVSKLLWRAHQCRGYILLLTDPSSLMNQAEYASHDAWDYSGRMVIVGLSRAHIETLTRTRKGRKTENIIGIVQDKAGNFVGFTNLLYKKDRLSRIFTWRTPVSSSPRYSTELSIKQKSDPEAKSFVMKQTTPTPFFTQQLFPDKTKNLQGSTLNVGVIPLRPEIMYRYDAHGNLVARYGGNVRILEAVSKVLNFTMRYSEPKDALWGSELPNGSWTGLVGMFARGEADIGIGNLYISALGGRHVHQGYSAPYGQQSTCCLVGRGTRMPRWQSLGLPFKRDTWIAVIVMALCAGPVFFALSRPRVTSDESLSGQSLVFFMLYTLGAHLKIAQSQLPVRISLQVFVVFLWVYLIIVNEAYTAKLVSFLTVERIPEGINTFEDLYKNSLTIYGNTIFFKHVLAVSENVYAREKRAASNDSVDGPVPESGNREPFSLEHLQGVFIIFGVGCGLSLLVFTSELLLEG